MQPREVRRNACKIVVGREPCEDTRAILVTKVMSLYTDNCFGKLTRGQNGKSFTLLCILDSISFFPVDNFQVTLASNFGVQCSCGEMQMMGKY